MGERIALTGLAHQQRAAGIGNEGSGVGGQHGNQDDWRSIHVGGDTDTAGQWRTGRRIEHGEGAEAGRAQQCLGQTNRLRVGFPEDIFLLLFHETHHNKLNVMVQLLAGDTRFDKSFHLVLADTEPGQDGGRVAISFARWRTRR